MKPMKIVAMMFVASSVFSGGALGVSLLHGKAEHVDIQWTEHDVPHITAQSYKGLGYGYGYVLAQDRVCALADHIIGLRGERSQWYGAEGMAFIGFLPANNLSSDLFYRVQLSDELVDQALSPLTSESREMTQGFVAGLNAYVEKLSAAERQSACQGKPIPDFKEADIVRALLSIGNTGKAFHVGPSVIASGTAWKTVENTVSVSQAAAPAITLAEFNKQKLGFGSNAWVFGGDVVEGDGAMVLGNPHTSWADQWLSMHQAHWTIPGELDVAGATFLGLPLPQTGFNKDVAWSILQASTVTWQLLQVMDVDETAPQPSYVMDEVEKPLTIKRVTIKVLGDDEKVTEQVFHMAYSELGPIYKLPAAPGRPEGWYAVTDIGDGNARGFDQFLDIARSSNIKEFVKAVEDNRGLGSHLVAGDRYGDTAYVEAGPLFGITDAELASCHYGVGDKAVASTVLDGSRRVCSVRSSAGNPLVADASKYPTIIARGIIHNTNNSYKDTVFGERQKDYSVLLGSTTTQDFDSRGIMSARQMKKISADGTVTPKEALQVVFDNRNLAAEEWLDDILALCKGSSVADVKEGCTVLKAWDRKNNADSKGALLFHQFWNTKVYSLRSLLPLHQPRDPYKNIPLNLDSETKKTLLEGLAETVRDLKELGYRVDEEWGHALYAQVGSKRIALNGGSGLQGILNVEEPLPLTPNGFAGIMYGTAYMQLVRWENGNLIADVLLAHGQHGSQPSTKAKQLQLFSDKQLYRFPFSEEDLAHAKTVRSMSLTAGLKENLEPQ